jgi:hypothetical protein
VADPSSPRHRGCDGKKIISPLIFTNLRIPQPFDFFGVFSGAAHAPALDLQRPIDQTQRSQPDAQPLELHDKRLDVKLRHCTDTDLQQVPRVAPPACSCANRSTLAAPARCESTITARIGPP